MKTISLNTDRVLIGSSNITYYGESLKSFGVTGNPKIFELDKDKFNLNIYGSMTFTGSGRINLNGSTINLSGNNIHLTGSNISLNGKISLNGSQDFNIFAYTGGTIKLDNHQSNITLSGEEINIKSKIINLSESEIINLSGSEINIESDYLHIRKTGSNVEVSPYTGKSLILNGYPITLNGSVLINGSNITLSSSTLINGSGSLHFREFSKVDILTTGSNTYFRFGADSRCFVEGGNNYINLYAGYNTGVTGAIDIFSRDGEVKLRGSNINLSGSLTITVGSETYLFSSGSFVLQS